MTQALVQTYMTCPVSVSECVVCVCVYVCVCVCVCVRVCVCVCVCVCVRHSCHIACQYYPPIIASSSHFVTGSLKQKLRSHVSLAKGKSSKVNSAG